MNFKPISLNRQNDYLDLLAASMPEVSDYSFINFWGWADAYGLQWAWENNLVWIRQTRPAPCFWGPVGRWEQVDWSACFRQFNTRDTRFIRIPEKLAAIWQSALNCRIEIAEARDDWDYVYRVRDLVELKGNRYHKKKNLLNQFNKNYTFTYEPMTVECIEHALAMQEDWCTWRDCESSETLSAENRAIEKVLLAWNDLLKLMGGALFADGKMIAFTVAEQLTPDSLVIHFEKGLADYKGVYQAINQKFLENNPGFEWVNREQDIGDPGLRKAKLSYHPDHYVKKYTVSVID